VFAISREPVISSKVFATHRADALSAENGQSGYGRVVKLDHLTLAVRDWQKSRDWYVGNLGFRLEFELPKGGRAGFGVAAIADDAGLTVFLEQFEEPILSSRSSL
jgi:hypothetical protein